MNSTEEAAVVFQIRWMPPHKPEDLPPNFDASVSGSQEWETELSLSGSREPFRSDDLATIQWRAKFESSLRLAHKPLYASSDPELLLSLVGQSDEKAATYLSGGQFSAEPWHPPALVATSYAETPAQTTYSKSYYVGSKLGTSVTYYTAGSDIFYSAASGSGRRVKAVMGSLSERSEYFELLKSMGLWPVDSKKEHNWSGRGQHVEFKSNEMGKVNELLSFQECLGSGISGTVDKVKCSRIFLARKTISTRTRLTKSQAIEEVAQMDRHKHSHIIRLIGSYTLKTNLCILMYPVADHSLGTFLEALGDLSLERAQVTAMASSCSGFFSCLSSALRYIHSSWTKHMDIKPLNILVRTRWRYSGGGHSEYHSKVYLSDFGIARSYPSFETINTDGAAAFTRKYAAPEVIQQMHHGLSVDIFSLGCVFLEMFAALDEFKAVQLPNALQETRSPAQFSCTMQQELQDLLNSNKTSDESYQGNLNLLQKLLEARIPCYKGASVLNSSTLTTILKMIRSVPQQRPTADDLIQEFGEKACCKTGPDKLEEADIDWEHDFNWSPNRRIDFNQERIHSTEPWTQPILSGSTVYHHLSGTMSEELREHMAYQTLLTSHMGGVWS